MAKAVHPRRTRFVPVRLSLADLVGKDYVDAVVAARAALAGDDARELRRLAREKVDFLPVSFLKAQVGLLPRVGGNIARPLRESSPGASTAAFNAATHPAMAPLTGWGCYRIGEDGRLHFILKSEHYHAPLGHGFPGYRLLEHARRLGIPNATHNNTRGHITRLLEAELVRTANGLPYGDDAALAKAVRTRRPGVLNRVLNLETGSLAAEAGIKMMLARFYRIQQDSPEPQQSGTIHVIAVIGDDAGGLQANYHGTTILAQALRGMWHDLRIRLENDGFLKIVSVRPNNFDDLENAFARHARNRYKLAGFIYEIVLMNYGGRLLSRKFVRRIHELARKHGVPTMVDEIQTGVWSTELFMFREYGVRPTLVAVGKGFPGGEYPASRIVFQAQMDTMPQFGALVTNGQEELASLAYLVTMRWAEANAAVTCGIGEYYSQELRRLVETHPQHLSKIEGCRHLASLYFHELDAAKEFVKLLANGGLDISVQAYKANCPPGALTKLPLIAGYEAVDMVIARMDGALRRLADQECHEDTKTLGTRRRGR